TFKSPAACAIDRPVGQRKPHGNSCVFHAAFLPGFRKIALLESYVFDFIDDTTPRVFGKLLRKIRQHLRRYLCSQRVDVFSRVCGLNFIEQPLKRIIVGFSDRQRFAGWSIGAEHTAEPPEGMTGHRMRGCIGRRRHISSLPPGEQQPRYDHDQNNLKHEPENGRKAGHSTEKSVPEQKTKETGAEKPCRKSAKQSSAKEARSSRRLSDRTGLAGL